MPGCEGIRMSHHHHHHHHELIQKKSLVKEEEEENHKPFSRLLSKEVSQPNSSCRVYYGETAVAIPFVWESQPGTPKHALFSSSDLPPLTPPPAYSYPAAKSSRRSSSGKPKFDLLVGSIFARTKSGPAGRAASSVFSLSSLSSSSSSSSSGRSNYSANSSSNRTRVSRNVAFDQYTNDHDSGDSPPPPASPTSTLCLPAVKKTAWRFVTGCYVKNGRVDH